MQETETIQGNRLIAEFMGWKFSKSGKTVRISNATSPYRIKDIHYHSSWDWLMPVVEKVNTTIVPEDARGNDVTYVVTIEPGYCVVSAGGEAIVSEKQAFDSGEPLIDTVYWAVLQFIQWYNEHKTTT